MSREVGKPQSGYTQLLDGSYLATARAVNINCHHKHCYHIAKALRGMNASNALLYLDDVINKKKLFHIPAVQEKDEAEIPWLAIERVS